jgi:hypothetical protein
MNITPRRCEENLPSTSFSSEMNISESCQERDRGIQNILVQFWHTFIVICEILVFHFGTLKISKKNHIFIHTLKTK